MVALWLIAVLFFLLGASEPAFLPLAILLVIGLTIATLVRKSRQDEIQKSPPPHIPRAAPRQHAIPVATLNIVEPYTCKSCGAANPGGGLNTCDFCGAAAPVVRSAPPPVPVAASPRPVEDEGIGVSSAGWVCRSCSTYVSIPGKEMPGSLVLEIFLWFLYIIPGVLYTMWRRSEGNAVKVCSACGSHEFTPVASPEGRSLFMRKYGRRPRFD